MQVKSSKLTREAKMANLLLKLLKK
jgi:hypothetical protein